MAEFVLGRIKFVYRGAWTAATAYVVDDVVSIGGRSYMCVVNHTASTLFATDSSAIPPKWNLVADGQQWRNTWLPSTYYNIGDLVKYGGIVYQCNAPHTSATNVTPTYLGLENDQSKWDAFATSPNWLGPWATSTRYKAYDFVSYGGYTYICKTSHVSAATSALGLETDQSKWDTFNAGLTYLGTWDSNSVRYKINDVVKYGADLWICTTIHTSSATFDDTKWSVFVNGFQFENSWVSSTVYQIGDTVTYGGYSYIAKTNNTNKKPTTNLSDWDVYTTGFSYKGDWSRSTSYKNGELVRVGGYTYLCTADSPSISTTATDTIVSTDGTNPNTIIADTTGLVAGMAVTFGTSAGGLVAGSVYYVLSSGLTSTRFKVSATAASSTPVTLTGTTGQTITVIAAPQPPNTTYWSRLNSGLNWTNPSATYTSVTSTNVSSSGANAAFTVVRTGTTYALTLTAGGTGYANNDTIKILGTDVGGVSPANDIAITISNVSSGIIQSNGISWIGISVTWSTATSYVLGDIAFFGANSYICVQSHTSSTATRPNNDTTGAYWNLLAAGAEVASLTSAGDTFYYGANGPARLPIGADGTVLRSTGGYPTWSYFGVINNLVYVGPLGQDSPAPLNGTSIDKPWKTVRYAAKQIEQGYLNPQAQQLLAKNKQFLLKEVNNYISYTFKATVSGTGTNAFTSADTSKLNVNMPITFGTLTGSLTLGGSAINTATIYYVKSIVANTSFTVSATAGGVQVNAGGTGTAVASFSYDATKTERDAGYTVDAVVFDIGHGGTQKTTAAILAYYTSAGTSYITSGTGYEITQFIAAQNYLKTLMTNVLANTAPAQNYQTLNSASTIAYQQVDNSLTTESGVTTTVNNLIGIITTGMAAGTASIIAPAINPNTTISVKTGTYSEVLPIVVPGNTAVVGDELRGTVIQPATANPLLVNDKAKTISALTRIKSLLPNLLTNQAVTPTTGNTQTQQIIAGQLGTVGNTAAVSAVVASANVLYDVTANGIGTEPSFVLPQPTGYNASYLIGYGDGKAQLVQNYAFIKDEISQYLSTNYNSVWTALGATGQAKCQRDVSYILDALQYDMTYGGNFQTLIVGSSYYSNYILTIASVEKAATIAAYTRLKAVVGFVTQSQTSPGSWTKNTALSQTTTGSAGSAGSATFAQARIQDIIDWINNGTTPTVTNPSISWTSSAMQTSFNAVQAKRTEIQSDAVVWVKKFYQNLSFNSDTCYRDAGLIVDALSYDMVFGSNFNAIVAGRSYQRAIASAQLVINSQLNAELGAINFIKYKTKTIAAAGTIAQMQTTIDDTVAYITKGAVPRLTWINPSNIVSGYAAAAVLLQDNKAFLQAEVIAYINANTPPAGYSQALCARDTGYVIDAMIYDLKYGGNFATIQAAKAYWSFTTQQIAAGEVTATTNAFSRLSTVAQQVIQNTTVSATSGNTATQIRANGAQTVGSAGAATSIGTLITSLNSVITNGLTTGVPTLTITTIASGTTFTSGTHGLSVGDLVIAQTTTNGLTSGTTYFVQSTPLTTTFTLAATYGGSAISTFTNGTGLSIVVEKTNQPVTSQVDANLTTQYVNLSAALATIKNSVTTFISTNYPTLIYNNTTCLRDVGYFIDAIGYDMMLSTNFRSVKAGMSYYRANTSAQVVLASQKAATIATYNYLKTLIAAAVVNSTTAVARSNALMDTIIAIIDKGVGTVAGDQTPEIHGSVNYNNTLGTIKGAELLRANKTFLTYEATAWITASYGGTITYTTSPANTFTVSAAHNLAVGDPVRFTATTVNTSATATTISGNLITVGTTVGMVVGMPIVFTGTNANGITTATTYYIKSIPTPGAGGTITVSNSSTNGVPGTVLTISGTGSVSFTVVAGGVFGGITANTTYYVLTVPTTTTFTVTATQGSITAVGLTSANGVLTATYGFNEAACRSDMSEWLDALIYDTNFTGTYRSLRAAKIYNNAVSGSITENMFLVRNGTGLRNMTMSGLTGYLTNANIYGTKRPTAGAYSSLDEGFGPNDSNVWITSRSCYTQNCTMFGYACVGMKIDAALHAGGNKSIVANDYTTIIGDGIGVWATGSGALTELVSVFNYYGYAGYLAELGAKMRATNGNSSYGTYGVIAEGVDSYETPIYATTNNRFNPALVSLTVTDAVDKVQRLEFSNAGSAYTNVAVQISGAGYNATAIGDETRDGAVFETRLIDLNDGNGYGGTNYLTAANTAQSGDAGSVTISAADTQLSTAYVGMRIVITGGTGAGQSARILNYGNGSKVANIAKESFATLTVTGSTAGGNNLLTVASTASMYVGMPVYFDTTFATNILAYTLYYVIAANFSGTQFAVSTTPSGSAVTTTLTTGQTVSLFAAGWDHIIPGSTVVTALDLTSTYIIEPRITYTSPGYTATSRNMSASASWTASTFAAGKYVAVSNGTAGSYSNDGKTWSATGNLPTSANYIDIAYGGGQNATATATVGGLGGSGAVLVANLGVANTTGAAAADQVASVTIVNGGFAFTTAPTIVFSGGAGSGASATCTVKNGSITTVTITVPGSGYTSAPTVAAATDRIASFTVQTWGKNYPSAPTVTVSDPFSGTAWSNGGSATLNGIYYYTNTGVKNWYQVTVAGTFTTTGPIHTSGTATNGTATLQYIGTTANGTAVLTNGGVSSITLTNSGQAYTTTPTVTIIDANAKFVTIPTTGGVGNYGMYNTVAGLGSTWTATSTVIPTGTYTGLAFGGGYYVAVGGTASSTRSSDGLTWGSSGTLPVLSGGSWSSIAYGGDGRFVAINSGGTQTAYSTTFGNSWTAGGALPSSTTWTSIAYGNGRFVAIASSSTAAAYTVDNGVTWKVAPAGLPASVAWSKVSYGQGLFFAVATSTATCATSPDGINWTLRAMPSSSNWKAITFGNVNGVPLWSAISNTTGVVAASINTGATAQSRAKVVGNAIIEVRMWEPGSAYPRGNVTATTTSTNLITVDSTENLIDSQPIEFIGCTASGLTLNKTYFVIGSTITSTQFKVSLTAGSSTAVVLSSQTVTGSYRAGPILTQTDPNKVKTAAMRVRVGDGAVGQPTFTNRGTANTTATSSISGDGYSDLYQPSNFINVGGLYSIPLPGANVEFASIPSTWFKLVAVTNILGSPGNYTAQFQINPSLSVLNAPAHNDTVTTRLKYSQCRLTGHDFLYIGTGNQAQTNYPFVDTSKAVTANQSNSSGGGRAFFTSTDQDGNFNVGNLFGVQQSTGTATLNASAFNLSGLQSLQLGTVSVGAGSAVITSFSTDPYFTANSDSVIPTQRAIKSYITAQIGGGQSSLNVNTLTSGVIYIANNSISTTTGVQINVKAKMNFTGGIDGAPVALGFFMQK